MEQPIKKQLSEKKLEHLKNMRIKANEKRLLKKEMMAQQTKEPLDIVKETPDIEPLEIVKDIPDIEPLEIVEDIIEPLEIVKDIIEPSEKVIYEPLLKNKTKNKELNELRQAKKIELENKKMELENKKIEVRHSKINEQLDKENNKLKKILPVHSTQSPLEQQCMRLFGTYHR